MIRRSFLALSVAFCSSLFPFAVSFAQETLLNVSYDPTRELYNAINQAFSQELKKEGKTITIRQSHGGSGKQARGVIAQNFYRPREAEIAARYAEKLPKVKLFTIDEVFGSWAKAHATHFSDGGLFDALYAQ